MVALHECRFGAEIPSAVIREALPAFTTIAGVLVAPAPDARCRDPRASACEAPPVSGSSTPARRSIVAASFRASIAPQHRRSFLPGIDDVHRSRIENLEFRVVFGHSSTPWRRLPVTSILPAGMAVVRNRLLV
jgi:hypothetical protein